MPPSISVGVVRSLPPAVAQLQPFDVLGGDVPASTPASSELPPELEPALLLELAPELPELDPELPPELDPEALPELDPEPPSGVPAEQGTPLARGWG
jgi:hypothetical protein